MLGAGAALKSGAGTAARPRSGAAACAPMQGRVPDSACTHLPARTCPPAPAPRAAGVCAAGAPAGAVQHQGGAGGAELQVRLVSTVLAAGLLVCGCWRVGGGIKEEMEELSFSCRLHRCLHCWSWCGRVRAGAGCLPQPCRLGCAAPAHHAPLTTRSALPLQVRAAGAVRPSAARHDQAVGRAGEGRARRRGVHGVGGA